MSFDVDKEFLTPSVVTISWGDGEASVPFHIAIRIHFQLPHVEVRVGEQVMSDREMLRWIEGECGVVPLEVYVGKLLFDLGFPFPRWWPTPQEQLAAISAGQVSGPTDPHPWRTDVHLLNPHPLPPSALDLVPARFRERVLDLVGLALVDAMTDGGPLDVHVHAQLAGVVAGLYTEFDELCPRPPRRRRRRGPFPPLVVLTSLVSILPAGRVQVAAAALAARAAERYAA